MSNNKKIKISVKKLRKAWGDVVAVKDIDLDIYEGDFITLLGPSGCGKTTTLRAIAGLEEPTNGQIEINGEVVYSKADEIIVAPAKRNLGLIFQSYALWPHMTVKGNIGFGLKMKKMDKDEIDRRVEKILGDVHLDGLGERYPSELSGGQQQRVAIARMLINQPQIFLMDEPLSNLDARLRIEMRSDLIELHYDTNATTIYVTHDQEEAMTLSTKVCVMKDGVIRQFDTPENIYNKPADMFVANFISNPKMNFFDATVQTDDTGTYVVGAGFKVKVDPKIVAGQTTVAAAVRPEDFVVGNEGAPFKVKTKLFMGSNQIVMASNGTDDIAMTLDDDVAVERGQDVKLTIKDDKIHLFDKKTELRLN